MSMKHQFSKSLTVLALSVIALNLGAQTSATPPSPPVVTTPAGTSTPATPPVGTTPIGTQPAAQGQGSPTAMSAETKRMTPDQMREYVSARNACGAPSTQTQPCNDGVHRRFTGVDPKCQAAFGDALTDCLQNPGKGK